METVLRAEILKDRGNIYSDNDQEDEALKDYTSALECNPSDTTLRVNILEDRGDVYFKQKNYDKAIQSYSAVLECNPSDNDLSAHIFRIRGDAYHKLGKHNEAIKDFLVVEKRKPTSQYTLVNALLYKGISFAALGEYDQGIEACKEALECLEPDDKWRARILYRQGKIYATKAANALAFECFNSALNFKRKSGRAKILFERACVYHKLGEQQAATQDLTAALSICKPDNQKWLLRIQNKLKELSV